ncbi:MAG TPA: response regulator [Actinomycetota bacterium]|jgi:DNA-binding response OmpR family regulator
MRVLVIDDEPDVLLLCRVNLAFEGHDVIEAADAPQGLDAAYSHDPDLIVLDVMLPNGDGISVLRELQSHEQTRDVPVILLTAKARGEDELVGFEAGATMYMTKPFSPAALCEAVATVGGMSLDERHKTREMSLRQLTVLQQQ